MENTNYSNGRVVNIDYLKQLSKGNTRFVNEMIKIFLAENPEEMRSLETAIKERDYIQVKATTHKLRSTLPYMGLDKVVEEEITRMEILAAKQEGQEEIESLFLNVKQLCERACAELQTT